MSGHTLAGWSMSGHGTYPPFLAGRGGQAGSEQKKEKPSFIHVGRIGRLPTHFKPIFIVNMNGWLWRETAVSSIEVFSNHDCFSSQQHVYRLLHIATNA